MRLSAPSPSLNNTVKAAEELQVFLFKLGARSFGVPLEQVCYVAPMPANFTSSGTEADNHFVYQGSPLTYVSLWDELGLKSEYFEYDELRRMLPLRLQDHVSWMDALESSILAGTAFTKARDPHQCAFGKWYYGYTAKDPRLSLLLGQFEKPHAAIHALADQLLALTETGQAQAAKRAFDAAKNTILPTLLKLFDDTQKRLQEMQRRIVVILTDGKDTWALGADDVRGIVAVPAQCVTPIADKTLGARSHAASALVTLHDHSVVPLLNWNAFCGSGGTGN